MKHRHPRQRFSQNFLVDGNVVSRLLDVIAPGGTDNVLEIGPGRGALSRRLARDSGRLLAIEIDRDLVHDLRNDLDDEPTFTVVEGDILKVDLAELLSSIRAKTPNDGCWRVVANLPYHISTPVLFRLLEHSDRLVDLHLMLQDEVVRRLAAEAGDRARGRLSVMVQYHCEVEPLFKVSANSFDPVPKVTSRIVRLTPRGATRYRALDYGVFERVVRIAFGQRRKTLRRTLSAEIDRTRLEQLEIVDLSRRPETLSVAEFVALADGIFGLRHGLKREPPSTAD